MGREQQGKKHQMRDCLQRESYAKKGKNPRGKNGTGDRRRYLKKERWVANHGVKKSRKGAENSGEIICKTENKPRKKKEIEKTK